VKVVLFCGGFGMRLREYSETIPKPMVHIGYRPILWHIMRYYAHYGHKEFILCLGYKADAIKQYFLKYDETVSNDFVLSKGGRKIELLRSDIHDWQITFVDTGLNANIGQRLRAVREYVSGEEVFLANYTDVLTNAPLPELITFFEAQDKVASFLSVRPTQSFHLVTLQSNGIVKNIQHVADAGMRVNGGFFVLKREIFDYMEEGDELVNEPFQRLIARGELASYAHDGFWACMDTFKERQLLEDMYSRGETPWEVWKTNGKTRTAPVSRISRLQNAAAR
jgi:glucose-1-phosphate cytidylyltransferase